MARPKKDLAGKKVGRLRVIRPLDERKGTHVVWECLCKCGNITKVRADVLKREESLSCGCLRAELLSKRTASDLTKQRFGVLVAERPTEKRSSSNSIMWECTCKCGRTVLVSATDLQSGRITSCGCTKGRQAKNTPLPDTGKGERS